MYLFVIYLTKFSPPVNQSICGISSVYKLLEILVLLLSHLIDRPSTASNLKITDRFHK